MPNMKDTPGANSSRPVDLQATPNAANAEAKAFTPDVIVRERIAVPHFIGAINLCNSLHESEVKHEGQEAGEFFFAEIASKFSGCIFLLCASLEANINEQIEVAATLQRDLLAHISNIG